MATESIQPTIAQLSAVFAVVFFFDGLALFALGLAVALEARRSEPSALAANLRYLAAFGLLQCWVAWLDGTVILAGPTSNFLVPFGDLTARGLSLALTAAGSFCLLMFAVGFHRTLRPSHAWLTLVPWILLAGWLVALVLPHLGASIAPTVPGTLLTDPATCLRCHVEPPDQVLTASGGWLTGATDWARYLLYFAGAVLAALALFEQARVFRALPDLKMARASQLGGVALAINAVSAGLIVTPAPFFPASVLNYATFVEVFGFPPQVIDALSAMVIAFAAVRLLRFFDVERARHLAQANDDRFQAQQAVLEAERRAQSELANWNKQLEIRITERTHQLEVLHGQLKNVAVLEERDRIARELHDSLAQSLGYLALGGSVLAEQLSAGDVEKAAAQIARLQTVIDEAYESVREDILGLRTGPNGGDLVGVVSEYSRAFALQTGIATSLDLEPGFDSRFSPPVATQIIRVIQEALANVRKHSGATRARVHFWQVDQTVWIAIEDDGHGFDPSLPRAGHFGLATMRERVCLVGGSLEIVAIPGQGTRVTIALPAEPSVVPEPPAASEAPLLKRDQANTRTLGPPSQLTGQSIADQSARPEIAELRLRGSRSVATRNTEPPAVETLASETQGFRGGEE